MFFLVNVYAGNLLHYQLVTQNVIFLKIIAKKKQEQKQFEGSLCLNTNIYERRLDGKKYPSDLPKILRCDLFTH